MNFYNKFVLTNKKKTKRFILAGAEQLHEKIFQLSDRVRQLEDALECLQSRCSNQPHPLLSPELLRIKTSQELYGTIMNPSSSNSSNNVPPSSGTTPSSSAADRSVTNLRDGMSLRELDNNNHNGGDPSPRGAADLMDTTTTTTIATEHNGSGRQMSPPEVAPDILQLSTTFPFPWMMDVSIRKRIRDALPPKAEAQRICEEARANALWQ